MVHNLTLLRDVQGAIPPPARQAEAVRPFVTETPAFRSWFGQSAVVDGEGKPMVVYHGTNADFNSFGAERGKPSSELGFFFSADAEIASRYAGFDPEGNFHSPDIGSVMPVYLSIKNPLEVDLGGAGWGAGR